MTKFRPCIDLHEGKVKQIVGGTLGTAAVETNFVSDRDGAYYAELYRRDGIEGGHVIMLGPGNEDAAKTALAAYPDGLQIGGGIRADNATEWLARGASHVIVTSAVFDAEGRFQQEKLAALAAAAGRERLVLDLSCRATGAGRWAVAMNRWQLLTDLEVTPVVLEELSSYATEFLVHAADVEGKCGGIDAELVKMLGAWGKRPVTYAGGAYRFEDLAEVDRLSGGSVDLTIGSALDIFGGDRVRYEDCVAWNARAAEDEACA